jgi:hypothetical protein
MIARAKMMALRLGHCHIWRCHSNVDGGLAHADANTIEWPTGFDHSIYAPDDVGCRQMEDHCLQEAQDNWETHYPAEPRTFLDDINADVHTEQIPHLWNSLTLMAEYFAAQKATVVAPDPYPDGVYPDEKWIYWANSRPPAIGDGVGDRYDPTYVAPYRQTGNNPTSLHTLQHANPRTKWRTSRRWRG